MLSLLQEILRYAKKRKKFWLLPIIIIMFVFGLMVILAQGSAIAPFIYTVF